MSFASQTRARSLPVLPLASLVDILFLLLTFFLTTSALREKELMIGVDVPAAETGEAAVSPAGQTIITVTAEDRVYLYERELPLPALRQTLEELAELSPEEAVVIRGDRASSFGLAVQVLDVAQQAGLRNVSVATVKTLEEIR